MRDTLLVCIETGWDVSFFGAPVPGESKVLGPTGGYANGGIRSQKGFAAVFEKAGVASAI